MLRLTIDFPQDYPRHEPILTFTSDVFHPLVTPLTTYTYTAHVADDDSLSPANRARLPPGSLSLRHGFPQWLDGASEGNGVGDSPIRGVDHSEQEGPSASTRKQPPLTLEVLQYLRLIFDTEALLDSVKLEQAANAGAWHAWKSFRSRSPTVRAVSPSKSASISTKDAEIEHSASPRQQPGGARPPSEWNWLGVWEDRVRKCVQASNSENALYGDHDHVLCFAKVDPGVMRELVFPDATVASA